MKLTRTTALNFHCPRWNELPGVPLYMDQVIMVVNESLAVFAGESDNVITKTMVNNYVKHGELKAPERKKYGRGHIATLIVITLLKKVLSLGEISGIIGFMEECHGSEGAYDIFCNSFEEQLAETFARGPRACRMEVSGHSSVNLLNAAITALTGKLLTQYYIEKISGSVE